MSYHNEGAREEISALINQMNNTYSLDTLIGEIEETFAAFVLSQTTVALIKRDAQRLTEGIDNHAATMRAAVTAGGPVTPALLETYAERTRLQAEQAEAVVNLITHYHQEAEQVERRVERLKNIVVLYLEASKATCH